MSDRVQEIIDTMNAYDRRWKMREAKINKIGDIVDANHILIRECFDEMDRILNMPMIKYIFYAKKFNRLEKKAQALIDQDQDLLEYASELLEANKAETAQMKLIFGD